MAKITNRPMNAGSPSANIVAPGKEHVLQLYCMQKNTGSKRVIRISRILVEIFICAALKQSKGR